MILDGANCAVGGDSSEKLTPQHQIELSAVIVQKLSPDAESVEAGLLSMGTILFELIGSPMPSKYMES